MKIVSDIAIDIALASYTYYPIFIQAFITLHDNAFGMRGHKQHKNASVKLSGNRLGFGKGCYILVISDHKCTPIYNNNKQTITILFGMISSKVSIVYKIMEKI